MFDIFVNFCRLDYVGNEDNVEAMRAVTEVYKQISALSHKFRDPKNGHYFILTPYQFYDQYLELIPYLPSDTTKWNIQLISQYYQAFTEEFRDRIMDDNFSVYPLRMGLSLNRSQLQLKELFGPTQCGYIKH